MHTHFVIYHPTAALVRMHPHWWLAPKLGTTFTALPIMHGVKNQSPRPAVADSETRLRVPMHSLGKQEIIRWHHCLYCVTVSAVLGMGRRKVGSI